MAVIGRVISVAGQEYNHLIPFQGPKICAEAAATCAKETMAQWRAEQDRYEEWAQRPVHGKNTISDEVMEKIKPAKPTLKQPKA